MMIQSRQREKQKSFFAMLLASLVITSCGSQGIDTAVRAKVAPKDVLLPTSENVEDWWKSWDKKTFLMGVIETGQLTSQDAISNLKMALAGSFFKSLPHSISASEPKLELIQKAFAEKLHLERQSLMEDEPTAPSNLIHSRSGSSDSKLNVGVYFVSLNSISDVFHRAAEMGVGELSQFSSAWSRPSGIQQLMKIVSSTPSVEWVEPNLMTFIPRIKSNSQQEAGSLGLAPEFKYNTSIVSVLKRIRADSAFAYVEKTKPTLSSVTVAVLDTGVDSSHPELKDQMFVNPGETLDGSDNDGNCFVDDVYGVDATFECGRDDGVVPRPGHADLGGPGKECPKIRADDELSANCGHGSHVAGIVAAKHGGDLSTIGVCPSCKILSIRVAERCVQPDTNDSGECRRPVAASDSLSSYEVDGGISDASQVRALTYLYNLRAPDNRNRLLVNVVNLSLGKYFASRSMSYIIRSLQRKNIIVVAAAGNDGTETPSYPAAYDSVVAVCATSEDYSKGAYGRAPFSNFGDWVDICAPGTDIVSTTPGKTRDGGGLFIDKSGTSQATPLVAGALGYLLSIYGNEKSAAQVVEMLKNGADSESLYNSNSNRIPGSGERLYRACYTDTSNCDNLLGAGFLDLDAAVQGKRQSKTNFNFLSNQPVGCIVSSISAHRSVAGGVHWFHLLTSMPVILGIGYALLRIIRTSEKRLHSGREER